MERQGEKAELTDSNDVLAQLGCGLHKHSGEDLHAGGGKAVDQVWALSSVTSSSTEALTSEDFDTLSDGVGLLHELGDPGHDGGAVVAGPLFEEAAALLAKTKTLASISSSDEGGVEAVGHVRPPGGKTLLASSGISSLGANLGDEDSGLLLN